jgi:hypothetical protein
VIVTAPAVGEPAAVRSAERLAPAGSSTGARETGSRIV